MSWARSTTTSQLPEWIASQRRDRGQCVACGQAPAVTIWAGTGQEICRDCCDKKREDNR